MVPPERDIRHGDPDNYLTANNKWRDGRVVECGGLENRCSPSGEPGVRIPLSPQSLNESRQRRDYLFYRSPDENLLSKGAEGKMNKTRRVHLSFARFPQRDHRR
jgi:hypothetical protein